MSNWVDDTKSKANCLLTYSIAEWRKDMVSLIADNWDASQKDAEVIVETVIATCKSAFTGMAQSYSCLPSSEVLRVIRRQSQETTVENKESALNVALTVMMLDTAYRKSVESAGKKASSLWGDAVSGIVSSIRKMLVKPNGYDAAVEMWADDVTIVSTPVKFESVYDRGEDDLLFSPKAALSLLNLVYSQKEQGISLKRSLIGFMVRDMMEILSILQWYYHEAILSEFSTSAMAVAADTMPCSSMFDKDCEEILMQSVAERDSFWFGE